MRPQSTREEIIERFKLADKAVMKRRRSRNPIGRLFARLTGKEHKVQLSASAVPAKEFLLELPPGRVDGPKSIDFSMTPFDRNFWFNLVIESPSPVEVVRAENYIRGFRSRNSARLEYAMRDVTRLHNFVNGLPMFMPELVFSMDSTISGRVVAGTFAETIYLRDPSITDLKTALDTMRLFFEKNQLDPEWCGGQINIFFAGHGIRSDHRPYLNRGGLCLRDAILTPQQLHEQIMSALPPTVIEKWYGIGRFGNCRVDLYLDCCFSAQFAASVFGRIIRDCRDLLPGKAWCSSMDFQESFESDKIRHGLFTSHFLNDYSKRARLRFGPKTLSYREPSLRTGDVGRYTDGHQTPVLINFSEGTEQDFLSVTIPGAVGTRATAEEVSVSNDILNDGEAFAQWLPTYLRRVHERNW